MKPSDRSIRLPEVPDPVSLQEQIQTDIAAAMRSGDALRRDVLRMASSAAYNVEKKQGRALTDDEMLGVLTREVKTRRESVLAYEGAGRQDLADKEAAEIEILGGYLPQALSEAELTSLVVLSATGLHRRLEVSHRNEGSRLLPGLPADEWNPARLVSSVTARVRLGFGRATAHTPH